MRVLVVNLADNASTNIRDRLLEHDGGNDWQEAGRFRGHPLYQRAYDIMVQVDGPTIYDEDLTTSLADTGWPIDAVWFLSRHRAASGQPSLTVHPIGNHGREAKYGGQPHTLSPAASRDMGALLNALVRHRDGFGLQHEVTYEATHHGPRMQQPSLFVEIGSDEDWYDDVPSAEALAAAVTDVLDAGPAKAADAPAGPDAPAVLVGVGGGHYVPQQTAKALAGDAVFGHFVPSYALDAEDPEGALAVLDRAVAATPGCAGAYVHKKGLKGPQRQIVRDWAEARGVALS